MADIGSKIKSLRTEKELSREKFAHMVDVTSGTIYNWETGVTSPTVSDLGKVASALGVTINDLLDI